MAPWPPRFVEPPPGWEFLLTDQGLAALAEAGRMLERPDLLDVATRLAELLTGGELVRSRRAGRTSVPGFLDDYANVAHGLYELHVATGDVRWLHESRRIALLAVQRFADAERGGFFMSSSGAEELVTRRKDLDDHTAPSGNSMLAQALLRLGRIWGDDELERRAVSVFRVTEPALRRAPGFFGWILCGLDLWLSPPRELAIVGDVSSPVARAALAPFQPRTVVAFGPSDEVPLLSGKATVEGKPTVYVCERFACQMPVTDVSDLAVLTGRAG